MVPDISTVFMDESGPFYTLQTEGSLRRLEGRLLEDAVIARDVAALDFARGTNFVVNAGGELWFWRSQGWYDWADAESRFVEQDELVKMHIEG